MVFSNRTSKKIASIVLTLILVVVSLAAFFSQPVSAGVMAPSKITIDKSQAGATNVTYTFNQTLSTGTAIDHIDIYFCTEQAASGTCTAPTGMNTGTPTLGTNNITGTSITESKISGGNNTIKVTIGSPATQDPLTLSMAFTGITNTSTANSSVYARIKTYSDASTVIDTGSAAIAVLTSTSITVTADVAPSFAFTVGAVNTSTSVNNATTTVTTTAGTIPFGTINPGGTAAIAAHDLTVVTNANNGYTVTIATTDPPLVSGSNNIDKFSGGDNATPAVWSAPDGTAKNVNSGFFGYTTEGSLGTGTAARFTSSGGNKWAGPTTSPLEVMYSANPTSDVGNTVRIGYEVQVNGYQPPGTYSGTVTLVATPTY
jgi:hypothetical protein